MQDQMTNREFWAETRARLDRIEKKLALGPIEPEHPPCPFKVGQKGTQDRHRVTFGGYAEVKMEPRVEENAQEGEGFTMPDDGSVPF
jgi:hypothetical protein